MSKHREHHQRSFDQDPNVLLTARKELIEEMKNLMMREVYRGFRSIWLDAKSVSDSIKAKARRGDKPPSPLLIFQKNLKLIPDWNTQVITDEFNMLLKKKGMTEEEFSNLLKSLFVINARIYSVLNMNKHAKPMLTIPSSRNFVHKIYILSSKTFIENPYLFEDRTDRENAITIQKNMLVSMDVIRKAVEDTIRTLTPVNEMLKEYMKVSSDDEDDDNDSDGDNRSTPERAAEEQLERLEKISQMVSGKESIRKSERLGELINEELNALEEEHGLIGHLDDLASRRSGHASVRSDKLSPEIPEHVFDDLLEGNEPRAIGNPDEDKQNSHSHLKVAAHRTITESEAGQFRDDVDNEVDKKDDEEDEAKNVRQVVISVDDVPVEAIVQNTDTAVAGAEMRSRRSEVSRKLPVLPPTKKRNNEFLSDDEDD